VQTQLQQRFDLQPDNLVTLRTEGIGESSIQQRLQDLTLPPGVQLGFRATPDEVQTKLLFPANFSPVERQQTAQQVADKIGDYVFAIDGLDVGQGGDLLTVIDRLMSNHTLATLETASGGLLAAKCQGRAWLVSAKIAKDLASAAGLFSVCPETLEEFQTLRQDIDIAGIAQTLAAELKRQQQTELGLVQLFAGSPDDYRRQDRSIVLYNGLQTGDGAYQSQHRLSGVPQTKQNQAALLSLDLLRRYLQNKCH